MPECASGNSVTRLDLNQDKATGDKEAETLFEQVKMWITLNEPWVTSICGHGNGEHAPGLKSIGESVYVAAHNQVWF